MPAIALTVNGTPHGIDIDGRALLVDVLREGLGLTGTHVGCDTSQCGACTVHLDGRAVKACTVLAVQADGHEVLTIEGIGTAGALHPMQVAFREHHGLQCGFCTPGMIMAGLDIARRNGPSVGPEVVREELEGNLCRCTGYHNIVNAIMAGAQAMGGMQIVGGAPDADAPTVSAA
ncbi:(2Fe-2S)-binding protein [Ancylobacter sp. 6x-1]|uniref:(2Fe-2S)-binding protein n=1 Tax=Ancylobacter crimeensis TaxID=2579147 RepID=A0ABT0DBF8_9HYPH|nr:(2Fe-2S)-binding protein [Ancylobacter crimeensis]MCK0197295.1 (2Fe-2S)-binding protein [Ancylobacter crimeensis]